VCQCSELCLQQYWQCGRYRYCSKVGVCSEPAASPLQREQATAVSCRHGGGICGGYVNDGSLWRAAPAE